MTIIGIEGGIGTGKTLLAVYLALQKKKKLLTNVKLYTDEVEVQYVTKELINDMFRLVKDGTLDMKNTVVLIQEMHNYMDARTSSSKKNRTLSYWVLQSRHTGEGSCDIIYDTQELRQVDRRLRMNTDEIIRPFIVTKKFKYDSKDPVPSLIVALGEKKRFHKMVRFKITADVYDTVGKYDTHEIVDF